MKSDDNEYKGLYFRDELMKKCGSAKSCYEYVRKIEFKRIKDDFKTWYDNYVDLFGVAPNGTFGIFYAPFPQNPEGSEEFYEWWMNFQKHYIDLVILFFNYMKLITHGVFGREENYNTNMEQIMQWLYHGYDLYLNHHVEKKNKNLEENEESEKDILGKLFKNTKQ